MGSTMITYCKRSAAACWTNVLHTEVGYQSIFLAITATCALPMSVMADERGRLLSSIRVDPASVIMLPLKVKNTRLYKTNMTKAETRIYKCQRRECVY